MAVRSRSGWAVCYASRTTLHRMVVCPLRLSLCSSQNFSVVEAAHSFVQLERKLIGADLNEQLCRDRHLAQ